MTKLSPRHLNRVALWVSLTAFSVVPATANDWPDWRGPNRDGTSLETGLIATWSPDGENLAWRVPYGGRSGPIVNNGHVYI